MNTQGRQKPSLKKGAWSSVEDRKLINYVTRYGIWNWNEMSKYAGLLRCRKSCRLRRLNYLGPDINRESFTQEEDEIIIKLHQQLGDRFNLFVRWSKIASRMPGRTDNDIKVHWNGRLKKRIIENNQMQETQTAENNVAANNPNNNNPPEAKAGLLLSNSAPRASNPDGCKYVDNFSSSSSDSDITPEENIVLSEKHQYFWKLQFTEEGLCVMDDFDAAYTSLWGLEEDISPTSLYDDLWS